ncbi:armadillo repeat-containing protein 6 [Gadus macrocephalus]|uniref:armadillo repeat-containing protein 6 n=1 Tax=Gadus macrocephalus TaxID=80720 RepID=UPI0028CB8FB7|nr:armadillo repeat-containing protein 6 [Gadus macrocephalus]
MARRRITQETFDAVVKENMDDFEMDPDDALKDAVEQFDSQGVDLTCIVKAVPVTSEDKQGDQMQVHEVLQALDALKNTGDITTITAESEIISDLKRFTEQCSIGFAQRHLASTKDAYPVILSCCKRSLEDKEGVIASLSALSALTNGQPDLLNAEGQTLLILILNKYREDPAVTSIGFRTIRHCCLKHEQNRQDLVKGGVLPLLTGAISRNTECGELVKEACATLRYMTFDDDIRVAFGNAHEHAKMIVQDHNALKIITAAAKAHVDNFSVLSELCATLSRLAVRNEYCQDICDLGGLKFMMTLLVDSYESQELVRQVFCALKAIAGNDDVKDAVVNAGGVPLIVIAMNRHMGNPHVCEQGSACLSVLALRKPKNCTVIMENGGTLAAVQCMRTHPDVVNVQRQACMLLRNLVSSMEHLCQPILAMGAQPLIAQALQTHGDLGDVFKAALRDLGCEVELKELWTGKKGSLTY